MGNGQEPRLFLLGSAMGPQQLSTQRWLRLSTHREYNTAVLRSGRIMTVLQNGGGGEE